MTSLAARRHIRWLLKPGQFFLLLIAAVCLGSYALNYGRLRLVQSYQSWKLDQASRSKTHSEFAGAFRWWDHITASLAKRTATISSRGGSVIPGDASSRAMRALPEGSLVGRVEIPRLGVSVMVLEGDDEDILQKAAGHVPTTSLPSAAGNVAIAGHRDTFFRPLRDIRMGDEIALTTVAGTYTYRVSSMAKVAPQDVEVLKTSNNPTLTLITCYPFNYIGSAPLRYVVSASEVSSPKPGSTGQLLAGIFEMQDVQFAPQRRAAAASYKTVSAVHEVAVPVEVNASRSGSSWNGTTLQTSDTPGWRVRKSKQETANAENNDASADSASAHKKTPRRHGLLGFLSRHFGKDQ